MSNELISWVEQIKQSVDQELHHACWQPVADVYSSDTRLLVKMELPGISLEQIQVEIDPHSIKISGSRHDHLAESELCHQQLEICYSSFVRTIQWQDAVDAKGADCSLQNGMLIVEMKKTKASQ